MRINMKNYKIIALIPFITLMIIHQSTDLSNFTIGLSYGIAIGIVILGFIPKELYNKCKSCKQYLFKH